MATTKKRTKVEIEAITEPVVIDGSVMNEPVEEPANKISVKEIDPHTIIQVINGFQGKLVYISPRTGEEYFWDTFGDVQEMELRELRSMKSSDKAFFRNNWITFTEDESWVIDYLGLHQYYDNALRLDEFDDIFTLSPAEIEKRLSKVSKGQKQSIAYRARNLIREDKIDSLKVIAALEKALEVQLVER